MTQRPYRIAMIAGDGIGQEVVPAAQRVLAALPPAITFVPLRAGWEVFQQTGTALPQSTSAAIRACDGAIFGATQSPSGKVEGYSSPILALRKQLDLYANLRPIRSMPVPGSGAGIGKLSLPFERRKAIRLMRSSWPVMRLLMPAKFISVPEA